MPRSVGCDATLVGPPGALALDRLDVPYSVLLTLCMWDCPAGRHGGVGGSGSDNPPPLLLSCISKAHSVWSLGSGKFGSCGCGQCGEPWSVGMWWAEAGRTGDTGSYTPAWGVRPSRWEVSPTRLLAACTRPAVFLLEQKAHHNLLMAVLLGAPGMVHRGGSEQRFIGGCVS